MTELDPHYQLRLRGGKRYIVYGETPRVGDLLFHPDEPRQLKVTSVQRELSVLQDNKAQEDGVVVVAKRLSTPVVPYPKTGSEWNG